jgi:Ca2+-binding RTX toxin-like protein
MSIRGTAVNDNLGGFLSDRGDFIFGFAGNDRIEGFTGDDHLFGGIGNDIITDSSGNDYLDGGDGNDTLKGGVGNDVIYGRNGTDAIDGGAGNDIIDAGNDNDTNVLGGLGNDIIDCGAGNDRCDGGGGDDVINGGLGNDTLFAGTTLTGDFLSGDAGNDILTGAAIASGGTGADKFVLNAKDFGCEILDFSRAEGDKIDIKAIPGTLVWKGIAGPFPTPFGGPNEVRYASTLWGSIVSINLDADQVAEVVIQLVGVKIPVAGDFILN